MGDEHLDVMLREVVQRRGSDLHVKPAVAPRIRIDGRLVPVDGVHIPDSEEVERLVGVVLPPTHKHLVDDGEEFDGAYALDGNVRFRVNAFRHQGEWGLVFRRLPTQVPGIEALGLPPAVRMLAEQQNGLILVTGPAGSGKTTTAASMLDHVNKRFDKHIVTIEDPIEIVVEDRRSLVNQRQVGLDTKDFASGLRYVLRQDPDVILIGEMRDAETALAAITAAETGHLVISTLHTVNAAETVLRLIDMFPGPQQAQIRQTLASTLRGVVSLRLVERKDGKGRVPAVEVLVNTGRVADRLIDPSRTAELEGVIANGEHYGMQTFDQHLRRLYTQGVIARAEALRNASHPHDLGLELDAVVGPAA